MAEGMHSRPSYIPNRRLGFRIAAVLLTVWVSAFGPRAADAAPGDLDPAFGTGGKVATGFGGTSDSALDLVVQPDGKLVAAGYALVAGGADFALARYNADGSLDATFGTGGRVMTDFGADDAAYALVVQPDGKLVAAGMSAGNFALARYNTNGTLDLTFGSGTGKVATDFPDPAVANALVVQPDGKLVAAGMSAGNFALARYNTNGTLDLTFGSGTGKVATDFGSPVDWASALVVQPDGKLAAAGYTQAAGAYDFALARYNTNGTLDLTFGSGTGKVVTDFGGSDAAVALVVQPDGKLAAAGSSGANFALARYNTDGSLDLTFGAGTGKATTDLGGTDDQAYALVVQPDGKLAAAGVSSANFALARYHSNGSLDPTFGAGGKVITDFGGPDDLIAALVLQPDGKLAAAGVSSANFALARYQGGSTPAMRMLTITQTGTDSAHRTFPKPHSISVEAAYYDANDACLGVDPLTVKFFVLNLEGQLVLGRNRDAGGGVINTQIGTSKYQALVATLDPGTLPPGAYNVIFRVEACPAGDPAALVSEFYAIEVMAP